jgi:hypothetical protein
VVRCGGVVVKLERINLGVSLVVTNQMTRIKMKTTTKD